MLDSCLYTKYCIIHIVCVDTSEQKISLKRCKHSSVFLKLSGLVQILQSRALRQGVGVVDSSRSSFAKGKPGLYVFFSLWRRSLGGRFGCFFDGTVKPYRFKDVLNNKVSEGKNACSMLFQICREHTWICGSGWTWCIGPTCPKVNLPLLTW